MEQNSVDNSAGSKNWLLDHLDKLDEKIKQVEQRQNIQQQDMVRLVSDRVAAKFCANLELYLPVVFDFMAEMRKLTTSENNQTISMMDKVMESNVKYMIKEANEELMKGNEKK